MVAGFDLQEVGGLLHKNEDRKFKLFFVLFQVLFDVTLILFENHLREEHRSG